MLEQWCLWSSAWSKPSITSGTSLHSLPYSTANKYVTQLDDLTRLSCHRMRDERVHITAKRIINKREGNACKGEQVPMKPINVSGFYFYHPINLSLHARHFSTKDFPTQPYLLFMSVPNSPRRRIPLKITPFSLPSLLHFPSLCLIYYLLLLLQSSGIFQIRRWRFMGLVPVPSSNQWKEEPF